MIGNKNLAKPKKTNTGNKLKKNKNMKKCGCFSHLKVLLRKDKTCTTLLTNKIQKWIHIRSYCL